MVADRFGATAAARPISVGDLMRTLRRQWFLVVCFLGVALAASAYSAANTRPTYTAETQLLMSATPSNDLATLLQSSNFILERMPSYLPLVNSPRVVDEVVQGLGLDESPETVAQRIEASVPRQTALIKVSVHDDSPEGAYDLAQAVGSAFGPVVESIESSSGLSPIRVTMVNPPELPAAPDSPGTTPRLVLGLMVGLGLGVAAAVLREVLDKSVKDPEMLWTTLGIPPLATVPADAPPVVSLSTASDPSSSAAEGFRQLGARLRFLAASRALSSVVVTSPRDGDSTGAVACGLAITLGQTQLRVLLVDADMRRHEVTRSLELDGRSGLADVLIGSARVKEAVQPWGGGAIDVLPVGATEGFPLGLLASAAMNELLETLQADYDIVVVSTPSLLPATDAALLTSPTTGSVLVVRHRKTSMEDVRRAAQVLDEVDARLLGAVVTRKSRLRRTPSRRTRPSPAQTAVTIAR